MHATFRQHLEQIGNSDMIDIPIFFISSVFMVEMINEIRPAYTFEEEALMREMKRASDISRGLIKK